MGKWKLIKKNLQGGSSSDDSSDSESENIPISRPSDAAPVKKYRWTNKQRVLIFASRGITYRDRHLMNTFRTMLAHSKDECKFEKKDNLASINEIAEMKNCNKVIYFENRKRKDTYMWLACMGTGPTAKFLVQNVHTMEELKFTGNCLRGSRPFLSFDESFDAEPWSKLCREVLTQIFGTPAHHPKSQPFFDHVFTFKILDKRIWFRNYQIIEEDGSLVEIGPRFCLNLVKIFDGPFSGRIIYTNPNYVNPNKQRRIDALDSSYVQKKEQQEKRKYIQNLPEPEREDPHAEVFETKPPEEAKGIEKRTFYRLDVDAEKEKRKIKFAKKKAKNKENKLKKKMITNDGGDDVWDDMEAE